MNLFDGQFKSKPNINLAGSSRLQSRDNLINQAIAERKKREQERKQQLSATKIQSLFRSYMIRKQLRHEYRLKFAALFSSSQAAQTHTDAELKLLLSYFVTFYDSKIDQDVLSKFSQFVVKTKHVFVNILLSSRSSSEVEFAMCKYLLIHLLLLNEKGPVPPAQVSHSVSLRLIDYFTDPSSYASLNYSPEHYEPVLATLLKFLINQGFLSHLVDYGCNKIPRTCTSETQAPLIYSIGHLINRTFLFLHMEQKNKRESSNELLIANKLCTELFVKCSTHPQVKLIVHKLAQINFNSTG